MHACIFSTSASVKRPEKHIVKMRNDTPYNITMDTKRKKNSIKAALACYYCAVQWSCFLLLSLCRRDPEGSIRLNQAEDEFGPNADLHKTMI